MLLLKFHTKLWTHIWDTKENNWKNLCNRDFRKFGSILIYSTKNTSWLKKLHNFWDNWLEMLKLIMHFKSKLKIKIYKNLNSSMAQMSKYSLCLDQILNFNHGLQNQNQHQLILSPIHTLIMMMEAYITKNRFQLIFQKIRMIF